MVWTVMAVVLQKLRAPLVLHVSVWPGVETGVAGGVMGCGASL